ncbi:MAG: phosphate ABC transporter substrate-binding protein PstS [Gaiellaceae bacterium]
MTRRGLLVSISAFALALTTSVSYASGAGTRHTAATLNGGGSSFVFPLVSTWAPAFKSETGITVNYNAIGSGAGIAAVSNRSVDFGASDAPLTPDQQATCNGCLTIPWAFSATAVAYNGTGLPPHLRITGPVLADIYLGKITNWSDPAIKALNPGVTLPDKRLTPIYRSDSSGTSYNFTEYLSAVDSEWKSKIGAGTQPAFPAGVGGAKSSGVSALLAKTDGGICYVDVAYALKSGFGLFAIKNRAGKFVLPGLRQITATAGLVTTAKADSTGLVLSVVDPPKPSLPKFKPITTTDQSKRAKILKYRKNVSAKARTKNKKLEIAYPICTFTYVIVPKQANQADALKTFFTWALTKGQGSTYGPPLRFVAIPKAVRKTSLGLLSQIHS